MTETKKNEALVGVGPGAIALPEYLKAGDARGAEDIAGEDLKLPRLLLAQGLSPQLVEDDGAYIPGLKLGDAFNSLSREVYGKGPLAAVVVRAERARFIEFYPRNSVEGKGVKDFNVRPGDPRTKFGPNGEKPAATKFLEFVSLLVPSLEPIVLTFKGSGLGSAKDLSTFISLPLETTQGRVAIPTWGRVVSLLSRVERDGDKTYAVLNVRPVGLADARTAAAAEAFYEKIKGQRVAQDENVAADAARDADVPF